MSTTALTVSQRMSAYSAARTSGLVAEWHRAACVEGFPHSYSTEALEVACGVLLAIGDGRLAEVTEGLASLASLEAEGRYYA